MQAKRLPNGKFSPGSMFNVFEVMSDGKWHSKTELQKRCGMQGDRRARQLRAPENGGFDIEQALGKELLARRRGSGNIKDTYYRLLRRELAAKPLEAANMRSGVKCGKAGDFDKARSISLTTNERTLLLAMLENHQTLKQPEIQARWRNVKASISVKLKDSLPNDMNTLYGLEV